MELPFMGTVASEDFFLEYICRWPLENNKSIDFVIPAPQKELDTYHKWMGWAEKSATILLSRSHHLVGRYCARGY